MTTRLEDGRDGHDDRDDWDEPGSERDGDDPLLVVLRPGAEFLGPPPGRYEAIRRAASRRRLLRAAAGAAATAAAAALIALPLHWAVPGPSTRPTPPLAPAPAAPTPEVSPSPAPPRDSTRAPWPSSGLPTDAPAPTDAPTPTAVTPSASHPSASHPSASRPSAETSAPRAGRAPSDGPGQEPWADPGTAPTPSEQDTSERDGTAVTTG